MLKEDPRRTHVPAAHDAIVALYESTNQPMVQPQGRTAQGAQAAVVALKSKYNSGTDVLVVLTLVEAGTNVVYAGDAPFADSEVPQAVDEALNFAESMGFILDSSGWSHLQEDRKRELIERMPAFKPPQVRKEPVKAERQKPADPLAAVARLFAAFAALCAALALQACTGMSAEQRQKSAEIHYDLGTNLFSAGDVQQALQEYLHAEQDDPELPLVHNALGLIYAYSLPKPQEAEAEFKRAIELDKNFSEAENNLGTFYLSRNQPAAAIPHFEKALSNTVYKDRTQAQGNLGWALYKAGEVDKGTSQLRAALTADPRYCLGWRQLGSLYAETGKLELAAESLGRYASLCPTADAHLQAGKVLLRESKVAEARAQLKECADSKVEKDAPVAAECARVLHELGAP